MGKKSSQTSSTKASPWIPSDATFNTFKNRADGTITDAFKNAMSAAQSGVNELSGANPYAPGFAETMASLQDPTQRSAAFDQVKQNAIADVMPAINASFSGSGMTGGSLHAQNLAKGVTSAVANVENDAYQQGNQQAMQAANLMNTAYGQDFARKRGLVQTQQSLGESQQAASSQALQQLLAAATGNASQSTKQSSNPGLLETVGTMASVASLFSDKRLKEDAKQVGKMGDGTPIHTYKYKPGAAPSPELEGITLMGVLAQNVKNKKAVEEDPSGFKRVNYGKL